MEFESAKLAAVPWERLRTASGTGEGISSALRELVAQDEAVRKRAYWKLDNHVVLQSDLYEAAYYVVPFLLEMLRERTPCGRDLIYNLLFEIANGSAPDGVIIKRADGTSPSLKAACREAVLQGTDIYRHDLSDEDVKVRNMARELLELLHDSQQVPVTG